MADDARIAEPTAAVATRTLVAAGFVITSTQRHRQHIDYRCERLEVLDSLVQYLVSVCQTDEPPGDDVENIRRAALAERRVLVLVARTPGASWMSWRDFLSALGGAVPSWRALGPDYKLTIETAARNRTPSGFAGEGWQVFEDAVGDGLEFILGRRVLRMGGHRRGQAVSDMMTVTPDERLLVIDAKASEDAYTVTVETLRPLAEYVKRQQQRQQGHAEVAGTLLVAASFAQPNTRLSEVSNGFLADTRVPLALLTVDVLLEMIERLRERPDLRNALRWAQVFCRPGLVDVKLFRQELRDAGKERLPRGTPAAPRQD